MEKKIKVMFALDSGGQKGRVFDRSKVIGTISATDYKDPPKVIKRWIRR